MTSLSKEQEEILESFRCQPFRLIDFTFNLVFDFIIEHGNSDLDSNNFGCFDLLQSVREYKIILEKLHESNKERKEDKA